MSTAFLLDYGSLSDDPHVLLTTAQLDYDMLCENNIKENNRYYCKLDFGFFKYRHSNYTNVKFTCDDFHITVHHYGLTHRSVEVVLDNNASKKSQERFKILESIAQNITQKEYRLFDYNCVTSVSTILAFIDPEITNHETNLVSPLTLDACLKRYHKKQNVAPR